MWGEAGCYSGLYGKLEVLMGTLHARLYYVFHGLQELFVFIVKRKRLKITFYC
jgi:hypothetical protein